MKRLDTWNGLPVWDDDTPADHIFDPRYARGCVERDYAVQPVAVFAPPAEMDVIPATEYRPRIEEQDRAESSLEHLYLRAGWENLDQGSEGYCWAYSTGHALMLARTRDNQPHARLNPHGPAAIIKRGRNEGGWCGLSAQFAREHGYPTENTWPVQSRNLRNDTPAMRREAAKYRIGEDWTDLAQPVYSQNLTFAQVATSLLLNQPVAADFYHMSHSVCLVRLVLVEAGSVGVLFLNSWKNWGRRGLGVLRGSKMYPNGAVCVRTVRAAA